MTEMEKKRDEMISALAETIVNAVDHVGKEALEGDRALLQLIELALGKVTELNERVHTLETAVVILTQRNDATRH